MDANIPQNRMHILNVVNRALHVAFDDDTVSIQQVSRHGYVLRATRAGGPRAALQAALLPYSDQRGEVTISYLDAAPRPVLGILYQDARSTGRILEQELFMAPRKKKEAGSLDAIRNYNYQRTKIVGADGKTRHSASNGDAVAKAMLIYVAGGGDLAALVRKNGLGDRLDPTKWDNQGLFRMSLGNSLRALVRGGTPVTIGDVEVKTLAQRVALPEAVEKKARGRKKAA